MYSGLQDDWGLEDIKSRISQQPPKRSGKTHVYSKYISFSEPGAGMQSMVPMEIATDETWNLKSSSTTRNIENHTMPA
jgi:hypothetical protein